MKVYVGVTSMGELSRQKPFGWGTTANHEGGLHEVRTTMQTVPTGIMHPWRNCGRSIDGLFTPGGLTS